MERLFDAVAHNSMSPHFLEHCAVPSICAMAIERSGAFVARMTHPDLYCRRAALFALNTVGGKELQEAAAPLAKLIRKEPDLYNRELALIAAQKYPSDPEVSGAVLDQLGFEDEMVRVQAAESLSLMLTEIGFTAKVREGALEKLKNIFSSYSVTAVRPEIDESGWRRVGDAILAFGDEGERVMRRMYEQKADYRLAELAWRILYLPLRRERKPFTMTEVDDRRAHEKRPVLDINALNGPTSQRDALKTGS
jgi:hypothetical protein